jgi:hypothetical protein
MLINSPNISGSLKVTGNTVITGSLTVLGGINATITGSATTASYVEYSNVANKPTLVSGSAQVSFNGITDKPTLVSGSAQITYSGLSGIPSGIVSSSTQITGYNIFATTGSNQFNGSQAITGSLTVTGQVVAQTLNVQQVTSSIVYSSGSNIFGNSLGNTQQFTGSVSVTGSLAVAGAGTFVSSVTAGSDINLQSNESYLNLFSTYSVGLNSRARIRAVGAGGGSGYGGDFRVSTRKTDNNWNTDAFVVDSSGNVGIGTTSPTYKLQVEGATSNLFAVYSSNNFGEFSITAPSTNLVTFNLGTGDDLAINTGGAERLRIKDGGNVGIGLTNPQYRLHITNSDGLEGTIALGNSLYPGLIFSNASTGEFRIDNRSSNIGYISFYPNGQTTIGNERMRITSAGNVGIGTTDPKALLHVQAPNNVTGRIIIKGGKNDVTGVGEVNSRLDFGSNDTSVSNDDNIGGRIESVTEFSNGAFTGLSFLTYQQGRSPDLKEALRLYNDGSAAIAGGLSLGGTVSISDILVANSKFSSYNTDGLFSANARPSTITTPSGTDRIRFGYNDYGGGQYYGRIGFFGPTNWSIGHVGDPGNDLSIGTGYRGENLYLYANGNYSFTGSNVSDIRLKQGINKLKINAVNNLLLLTPKSYYMKGNTELIRYGFIAQEVQEILPDLINGIETEDTYLGLDYNGITAILVKAIQEQQSQIEILKTKIEILEQS